MVLDPDIIDEVVNKYFNDHLDVCHLSGDFPTGLDTTIFSFNVLEQTHNKTTLNSDRQHMTPYMTKNKDFKVGKIFMYNKFGGYRFVMDRHEDFELIKIIYDKLYAKNHIFKTKAILELMGAEKDLRKINSHLPRDEDYNKSRLEEKTQD